MMKPKIIFPVVLVVAVCAAAGVYYLNFAGKVPALKVKDISPESVQTDIQKRVEQQFRRKQYAPMIDVYQKMLEKYPDSIDLKKKLGMAYFGAAEYDNARPLLEDVERAGKADDEVRRELDYIRKGNGKLD